LTDQTKAVRRIAILGCPGSGKTTLAKQLQTVTRFPLTHLDDEYWGPDWSRPSDEAWRSRQAELTAGPEWLIEGNYFDTAELRTAHADLIVILHASSLACLWRVLWRCWLIRRGAREMLPKRVREAAVGRKVRATRDLGRLVTLVARFESRVWWPLLAKARINPAARLLVVTSTPARARRLSGQLARRGVHARVLLLESYSDYVRECISR
jgi:adenylate kinase family enzyme